MHNLRRTPIITTYQSLASRSLADATGRKTSLLSFVIIAFLAIGVPVLFVMYSFNDKQQPSLILYPLSLLFLASVFLNYKSILDRRAHMIFYMYFLALFVSTLFARTLFFGVSNQIISLIVCFVWLSSFISIYYVIATHEQYKFAVILIDIVGVLIALSVFLSYIGPEYFGFDFGEIAYDDKGFRAFGPFGDQVGFVLGYFVLRGFARGKWLSGAFYLTAILATGTRGAIFSVAVGGLWLVMQVIFVKEANRKLRNRLVPILTLALASASFFLSSSYGEGTLARIQDIVQDNDSVYQRRIAIQLGIQIYADNPVLGVGFLGFNRLGETYNFGQYFGVGDDIQRGLFTAQNQYIQSATDAGTPGLVLLLLLIWILLREFERGRMLIDNSLARDLLAASAWVVAMALGNQAAVWILPGTITGYMFFLVMGLSLSLIRLSNAVQLPSIATQGGKDFGEKAHVS